MARVLFVGFADPASDFGTSVLFRPDIDRSFAGDNASAITLARSGLPNLAVVQDRDLSSTQALMRQLREHPETRRVRVVILCQRDGRSDEVALRQAGAILVLHPPVDPLVWDDRLEELATEPLRRDALLSARFVVWPQPAVDWQDASVVNISVRGLLLEPRRPLVIGDTLEISLDLPEAPEVQMVGQVVRRAAAGDRVFYGVDFVILRGEARRRIHAFVDERSRP
jgi:DNA-binding response OmpR family regulator